MLANSQPPRTAASPWGRPSRKSGDCARCGGGVEDCCGAVGLLPRPSAASSSAATTGTQPRPPHVGLPQRGRTARLGRAARRFGQAYHRRRSAAARVLGGLAHLGPAPLGRRRHLPACLRRQLAFGRSDRALDGPLGPTLRLRGPPNCRSTLLRTPAIWRSTSASCRSSDSFLLTSSPIDLPMNFAI